MPDPKNDMNVFAQADRSSTVFLALSGEAEGRNAPWYENLQKSVNDTPAEAIMAPWRLRTTRFSDSNQLLMAPSGRVTLVGDSAHAMPPDRGLGGNNVLEDARLLVSLLASSSKPIDWPKLTGEFEKEMFARAKIAVQESENAAQSFRKLRSHS
jgi:salicylate hydroxylase